MTDPLDSRVREMLERELPCSRRAAYGSDCDPPPSPDYPCDRCALRPALTAAVLELTREETAIARADRDLFVESREAMSYGNQQLAAQLRDRRRDALVEAAKAVCGLCRDGVAAERGQLLPYWWHPNGVSCHATAIQQLLAKEPK